MTRHGKVITMWLGLSALAACDITPIANTPAPDPGAALASVGASEQSQALARYYARVEADLLAQGLLRGDGGGVDTPYTDTDLARNFERIAFYDEYAQSGGFQSGLAEPGGLRKWSVPVRIAVEFGDTVPQEQRQSDIAMVRDYAARLDRITGHRISYVSANPNFHVLFVGEDDRAQAIARILEIEPGVNAATLAMIRSLPRSIHCIVVAFAAPSDNYSYRRAVALIRSEHPELTRRSCVHEELAQGLGLANDSPRARPSIFNDDDEFALLTTHDEELLKLLYNPALTPGMKPDVARPIIRRLLAARGGAT